MQKGMTNGNYLSKAENDRISFEILRKLVLSAGYKMPYNTGWTTGHWEIQFL